MTRTAVRRRPGFTLVEMLVVMALMVVIASLAVAVANTGAFASQKIVGAADRASGWLLIAKQRALRDQAPRGVRFLVNNTNPDPAVNGIAVTEAQYIESPDPWVPNPFGPGPINPNRTNSAGSTFSSGQQLGRIVFAYQLNTGGTSTLSSAGGVQQAFFVSDDVDDISEFQQRFPKPLSGGDFLVLPEFAGYPNYRITDYTVSPTTTFSTDGTSGTAVASSKCIQLTLATFPEIGAGGSAKPSSGAAPNATLLTYGFAFQPAPRPILGEPVLQLTNGTVIDIRPTTTPAPPTTTFGVTAVNGSFDILFAPAGQVMNNPNGLIALWVRDPSKVPHPRQDPATGAQDDITGYGLAGEQSLVCVYPRTGLIATQPVKRASAATGTQDVYDYAKDGMNSGL